MTAAGFLVYQCYRKTAASITRRASFVVFTHTAREISGDACIQCIINAFQYIKTPLRSFVPTANVIHSGRIVTKMPNIINSFVSKELRIVALVAKVRPVMV